jgi:hypothetical protein
MVIFLLAALTAYAACVIASLVRPYWNVRWLLAAAGLLLITLFLALYSAETGELAGLHRFTSDPATIQAALGALAGVMCRIFPRWIVGSGGSETHEGIGKPTPNNWALLVTGSSEAKQGARNGGASPINWWLLIFAVALACVAVAAMFAPYGPAILDRTSAVETPYLKVQFATSAAEKQVTLDIDRNLLSLDRIDTIPQTVRFIQFDCGQAALETGGMANFINQDRDRYQDFVNAGAFRTNSKFYTFVLRIINAQRRDYSEELLKGRVRVAAQKLFRLVSDPEPSRFHENYQAARLEVEDQDRALELDGIGKALPEEERERRQGKDGDPPWCRDDKIDPDEKAINRLVKETRYMYGFVAALLQFTGDTEGVIFVMSLAKRIPRLDKDINVNDALAAALYLGGRDLAQATSLFELALISVQSNERRVQGFQAQGDTDNDIREKLLVRYDRASFLLKLELAYLWAQDALRPRQDARSLDGTRLETAQNYVERAYERLLKSNAPQYNCLDYGGELYIKDAYAYVMLATLARNLQVHKEPVDQAKLHKAENILEDARGQVREIQLLIAEAKKRLQHENIPLPCMAELEARSWDRRISNHLKLAQALER